MAFAYFSLLLLLISWLLPISQACARSPVYLEHHVNYNTEKQMGATATALYPFTKEVFSSVSAVFNQSPITVPVGTESYYGFNAQAGYNTGMWGLDANYFMNTTSTSKVDSRGAGLGLTFAYVSGAFESGHVDLDVLKAAHVQTYNTEVRSNQEPLFWGRVGAIFNSMQSNYLDTAGTSSQSGLRQTGVTLDVNVPLVPTLIISGSAATYGYSRDLPEFTTELLKSYTPEIILIASKFRGLPQYTVALATTWQMTPFDGFLPRVQGSQIAATSQWGLDVTMSWRRKLTQSLYLTPTYDFSIQGSYIVTGLTVGVFYQL